jgi:membrane dipeptidase
VPDSSKGLSVIDLHADLPADVIKFRSRGEHKVMERRHLTKLRKGGVSGIIAPIWVESRYKPRGAVKRGLQILDAFMEDLDESTHFALATRHKDILKANSEGKIALILGCEGGEFVGDDIAILRNYYRLGLRSFGFVWNQRNLLADGMYHQKDDRGLTDFGKEVVRELNRLGVVVDLAHIAPKSFWDVIDVSKRPVIVSHGATAAHKSVRNCTDEQIRAVAESGGTFGVFAVNKGETHDIGDYIDHVERAIRVAGAEHVSLGPDFYDYLMEEMKQDGIAMPVLEGLEDHSRLPVVIEQLRQRGHSEEEIRMVARGNFLRVFKEVAG